MARGHVCMTTSPPNLPFCRRRFKLQHCSESLHDFRTPQKDLCLARAETVLPRCDNSCERFVVRCGLPFFPFPPMPQHVWRVEGYVAGYSD